MQVHEYLKIVEKQIRQEQLHEEIRQELLGHIEEQTDDFQAGGMSRAEAAERAVEEMGDPVETGVALDQVHGSALDVKLLLMVMVTVIAASVVRLLWSDLEESIIVESLVMWNGISLVGLLIVCARKFSMDLYKQVNQYQYILLALGGILTMADTRFGTLSAEQLFTRDAYRGLLNISVAEFAIIMFRCRGGDKKKLRLLAVMGCIPCLLSLMERSCSYTVLLVLAHAVLLSVGVCRGWYGAAKQKMMVRIWILPGILTAGGIFLLGREFDEGNLISYIGAYLERQDIPGILLKQFGGAGAVGIALWVLCMVLIAWRMIYDFRRLTNEYCRIVCLGVLIALGIQVLYSLVQLLSGGNGGGIYFPFLSPSRRRYGFHVYLEFVLLGIFLFHTKFDRALPKKAVEYAAGIKRKGFFC